jgi:hypothetical protein
VDGESHKIFFRRNKEEAMIWKKFIPLIAAVSILGLSACGRQAYGTPSEGAIQTAIAQTDIAKKGLENAVNATLTALSKGVAPTGQPSSATVSLTQGTVNLTPGIVTVSVSANTWCMTGPDVIYDKVFILYVGQTAEVIGKDAYGVYWVIKNPKNPAVTCWLWAYYATVTGDASQLPVITPPPTPTPAPGMVTNVTLTVSKSIIHGDCTFTNYVTVTITTNGPTMVHYILKKYLNGVELTTSENDMNFSAAGAQSSQIVISLHTCGTYGFKVIVTSPNSMTAQGGFQVVSP